MYLKALLLFIVSFLVHCSLFSQEYIPLSERLTALEKQDGISFSYDDQVVNKLVVVDTPVIKLEEELLSIAKQTGITFTLASEKVIILSLNKNEFCAKLIDSETKSEVINAQVIINNKPFNVLSDINGKVSFSGNYTFQDSVSFKHLGYSNRKFALGKLKDINCVTIPLVFDDITLKEVVIMNYMTTGIDASLKDHSLEIRTEDLALLPGETDGDVLAAIKTLPGITSPNGKAGNLHFRGSTTDQTLLLYDNMPIYHKGHYLGAISPYNPTIVDEIRVYRSGYSAALGGRVGGAIEINTDRSVPDSSRYGIGLNTVYGSAFAKIPVTNKWSVNGSIRSSYSGTWSSPKLEAIEDLVFTPSPQSIAEENPGVEILNKDFKFRDVNASSTYNTNSGQLFFSYIDIVNDRDFEFSSPFGDINITEDDLTNNGGSLNWLNFWTNKISTDATLSYSEYDYSSKIRSVYPIQDSVVIRNIFNNIITDVNFKSSIHIENEAKRELSFGYEVNHTTIDNDNFIPTQVGDPRVFFSNESFLHSLFTSYSNQFGSRLNLTLGLRGNYYTKTKDYRIEPRVTTSYEISPIVTLKSSVGLYSQYIRQNVFFDFEDTRSENLSWSLADELTPFVKSTQVMLGSILNFNSIIIDFEGYYKLIENLVTERGVGPIDDPLRYIIGDLEVFGGDVLIRKHWQNIDAWVNYSYLKTSTSFPDINQQDFLAYYDQPHTLNITSTAKFDNWKFSIGWYISSGAPNYLNNNFFPEAGPQSGPANPVIPSESNDGRFPEMHQLDLAAVYTIPNKGKGYKASIGISALNVYDQKNLVEEAFYTYGPNTIKAKRYNIGFAPNLMVNIEF